MSNPIIFGIDVAKGQSDTAVMVRDIAARYFQDIAKYTNMANTISEPQRHMTASEVMLRQRCFELSLPALCDGICVPVRKHVDSRVVELKGLPGGKETTQ